jgi:DNA-binding PadR family transcriptional regulator
LEKAGYVESTLHEASEDAPRAKYFELSAKAHLALFLSRKSPEDLLKQVTDKDAAVILSCLINVFWG